MKVEIDKSAEIIKNGGIILYPTDTVWGLGCDPNNQAAINKLFQIKKRADNKSCIILVNNERLLNRYVKEVPEVCFEILDCAVEPLTIIYPNGQYLSTALMGVDKSIGIRMTDDSFCSKLIDRIKSGIVSTSANISGEDTPLTFSEIDKSIINAVDYVVNLPSSSKNKKPSQIIKISENSEIKIIRK